MEDGLSLSDIEYFIGTEMYTNVMSVKVTDGIVYIMNNGYSWFVTDFISVLITKPKLRNEEFLVINLKIKDGISKMIVDDGNDNVLYTQKYEVTNAKKEFKLYCTNNVLMLSGEY